MKTKLLICCVTILLLSVSCHRKTTIPAIIPEPTEMVVGTGTYSLKSGKTIGIKTSELTPAAEYLQQILSTDYALNFTLQEGTGDITLSIDTTGLSNEGYRLEVTSKGIAITAHDYKGTIAALQSLRQLLPVPGDENADLSLSEITIQDAPRFEWRGIMLDVSRHFYDKEEIKRLLDLMAFYKLNKFHWHLTDDQGWRVEIKQYPELTGKGAWRHFNSHDKTCMKLAETENNPDYNLPKDKLRIVEGDTLYGGYYTQEDIREIVAYAAQRGIDIIPEIDMPGHFLAAIEGYPYLTCFKERGWGATFSTPICPGKDATLDFCRNVYNEIFQLFPYQYVHLGADEVEKTNWKKCPACQKRMKQLGLKTEEELQAWFVKEMEKHFNANGRQLIGWDEILEGGISPTATIAWWRGWIPDVAEKGAKQGNQVIQCPNSVFYFDYGQDSKTLPSLYHYNPVPENLTEEQQSLLKGVQANIWCEWIPSEARMQYMLTPRLLALSEVGWCTTDKKNWGRFRNKMIAHLPRLDAMNINYRIPDIEGFYTKNVFTDQAIIEIPEIAPGISIAYTTDGSFPSANSPRYTGPITVTESTDFIFRTIRPNGTMGDMVKTSYIKSKPLPAQKATPTENGVTASWYHFLGTRCAEIESAELKGSFKMDRIGIPKEVHGVIGLSINGYLEVPKTGIYTFALLSDDGSMLYIDGEEIINNDGEHSPKEIIGQVALEQGLHTIKVLYFDRNGGSLQLQMIDESGKHIPIDTKLLKR